MMVMLMLTAAIAMVMLVVVLAAAAAGMHGHRHELFKDLTYGFLVGFHNEGQLPLLVLLQARDEDLLFAVRVGLQLDQHHVVLTLMGNGCAVLKLIYLAVGARQLNQGFIQVMLFHVFNPRLPRPQSHPALPSAAGTSRR